MAFKAYGVGDFVHRVHGVEIRERGDVTKYSARARVTVDGVEFTPKRKVFPGKPTPAQLAANNVNIETLEGRPWPGSAGDRLAAGAPDKAPRVNADGTAIRLAGPNCMADAQAAGLWPTDRERELQAQVEAKIAHPEEYAFRKFVQHGTPPDKARILAQSIGKRHELPSVDDLLPGYTPPTVDGSPSQGNRQRKAS